MTDDLGNILLKKYRDNTLASLYLLTYLPKRVDPKIWAQDFQKEITPLSDHPDILIVEKDELSAEYKVDSAGIENFLTFINYRPLKLSKKFIFFFDAQDLSVIVSNKLLKVFEELSSDFCLILFSPAHAPLLPTVLSRAVKLKIPNSLELEVKKSDFSKVSSPQDLINYLKENPDIDELDFIEYAVDQCLSAHSFDSLDGLLKKLKDYETNTAFNNSKASRLSPFFL